VYDGTNVRQRSLRRVVGDSNPKFATFVSSSGREIRNSKWRSVPASWLPSIPAEGIANYQSLTPNYRLRRELDGADGVFLLASLWLGECVNDPRSAWEVNTLGTWNVVEACRDLGVKRVVYSSSASVYGNALFTPMTEDHPFNRRGLIPRGLPRSEHARESQGLNGDESGTPGFDHQSPDGTQGIRLNPMDTPRLAAGRLHLTGRRMGRPSSRASRCSGQSTSKASCPTSGSAR
jgi:hypothetical protein